VDLKRKRNSIYLLGIKQPKPKWARGMGLKRLDLMNKALSAKLFWRMLEKPNALWNRILQSKYLANMSLVDIIKQRKIFKGCPIWKTSSRENR
jgi:hypothetical protein